MNLVYEVRLRKMQGALFRLTVVLLLFLPVSIAYADVIVGTSGNSQTMTASDPGAGNAVTCYEYSAIASGDVESISFYQNVDTSRFSYVSLYNVTSAGGGDENPYSWQYAPNNYVAGVSDGTDNMELYTLSAEHLHNFYGGSQTIHIEAGDQVKLCLGAYSKPDSFPKSYGVSETLGDGTSAYLQIESVEAGCTENCHSNVLFLPGFLGSRLYKTGGRLLWEPNGSDDIRDLAMNTDGTSKLPVYVGDPVDRIEVNGIPILGTVYGELMDWLTTLVSEDKIAEWKAYPYDWRYDVFDVIDDGALKEDGTREYLIDVIEALAENSRTEKVTIIGHSNGGLLAKALMIRLEEQGKEDLVDKLIMVGTPEVGTPQGMLGLLHGHQIVSPIIALNGTARASATTMPGAYALLPSQEYFANAPEPVAVFETGTATNTYRNILGESIDSFATNILFLSNNPQTRTVPAQSDEETPLPLPVSLLSNAQDTHDQLDSWEPPDGVTVEEIAGWGNRTTVGARYYTETSYSCPAGISSCGFHDSIDFEPITTRNGDNTVVTESALFQDRGLYFDLKQLSKDFDEERKHENLTESSKFHDYLAYLLGVANSYNETLFVDARPDQSENQDIVSVHSPVIISLTDTEGRETGIYPYPNSDLFYLREEIPDSSIHFGGEGKYIYVPADGSYDISVTGTGSGTFDVVIEKDDGTSIREFNDLPVSTSTKATLSLENEVVSDLSLDINGDGASDVVVADTLSRRDAILICKKEIGLVRTLLVKLYLLSMIGNLEKFGADQGKFIILKTQFKKYLGAQINAIPSARRAGIATCITALENSK